MLIDSFMFRVFIVLSCIIFTLTKAQELDNNKTTSDHDKINKVACQKCEKPKDEEEKTWCNKNCPNNFKQRSIVSITTAEDYCVPCIREIIPIILAQCDNKCGFDIMRRLQKLLYIFASNPSFFEASAEMLIGAPVGVASSTTNMESVVEVLKHQGFMPPPPTNNHCGTIVLVNSYPSPEPIIETYPPFEPMPQPLPQPIPYPMPPSQIINEVSYEQVHQPSIYHYREDISSLQPFMNIALSIPEENDYKDGMKDIKLRSQNNVQVPSPRSLNPSVRSDASNVNVDHEQLDNKHYKDIVTYEDRAALDHEGKVLDGKYRKNLCKECINQQQLGNRKPKDCESLCYWAIFSP